MIAPIAGNLRAAERHYKATADVPSHFTDEARVADEVADGLIAAEYRLTIISATQNQRKPS
jgi:hypothetical protein